MGMSSLRFYGNGRIELGLVKKSDEWIILQRIHLKIIELEVMHCFLTDCCDIAVVQSGSHLYSWKNEIASSVFSYGYSE